MAAKKKSKKQRIDEKVQSGMTRIEAEIQVNREVFAEHDKALKAKQEREQERLDKKVFARFKEADQDTNSPLQGWYSKLLSEIKTDKVAKRSKPQSVPAETPKNEDVNQRDTSDRYSQESGPGSAEGSGYRTY